MPFRAASTMAVALFSLLPLRVPAVTATGLSSFEAIEEPLVKFFPASGRFEPDAFGNITDVGAGTFRFFARYNAEWWDGDRDTQNKDRQRMEVKGLGRHQKHDETFEYATTWRSNPDFRGTAGFFHIFQLKAINGDSGAPLITLSIRGEKATVEANPDGPKIIAREFPWRPDTWQHVRIRVKTTPNPVGELLVSVDGDPFQGKTGVALSRPGADAYRPKWGLYRRATLNAPMGDDFIEHRAISARDVRSTGDDNATLEREARIIARSSTARNAIEWLGLQPASIGRDFAMGSLAALWAETTPAAAMGWAEALKPGALRSDAIGRIFSRWADQDVAAASQWLHARAPDPAMDELIWLFVTDTTFRYVKREIALDAAPLIQDAALRANAFEHVVEIWSRSERDAAVSFTQKTPALTAEQKQAIVDKIRARQSSGKR